MQLGEIFTKGFAKALYFLQKVYSWIMSIPNIGENILILPEQAWMVKKKEKEHRQSDGSFYYVAPKVMSVGQFEYGRCWLWHVTASLSNEKDACLFWTINPAHISHSLTWCETQHDGLFGEMGPTRQKDNIGFIIPRGLLVRITWMWFFSFIVSPNIQSCWVRSPLKWHTHVSRWGWPTNLCSE